MPRRSNPLKQCKVCGRMTLNVSWTQIRMYDECGQKVKRYREGKRAPITDHRVFFAGTTTDRVVRRWLLDDPENNTGLMPHMVEEIMAAELQAIQKDGGSVKWKTPTDREEVLRECIEAVTRLEPILNKYVLPYEYEPDFKFKAPMAIPAPWGETEPILLIGAIDILVRDGDKWDIWDVKHTKDNNYWRKTVGQLTFYDISRSLLFEGESRYSGLLQPLCDERIKPYPVTEQLQSEMFQRIAKYADAIWRDQLPPDPKQPSMCNYCDVRHACSKFKPVVRDGKRRVSFGGTQ